MNGHQSKLTPCVPLADIALNTLEPHPDYVGIICTKSVSTGLSSHDIANLTFVGQNIHDIVQESIENARYVCEEHYG